MITQLSSGNTGLDFVAVLLLMGASLAIIVAVVRRKI